MSEVSSRPPTPGSHLTLGRLGGLKSTEADRGERAIWLDGGGYRAALFHLGALTRLNELGLLAQTGTVGASAGSSILAALLATRVPWPLDGSCAEWAAQVAEPMRSVARRGTDARHSQRRSSPDGAASAALEERYAREMVASLGGPTPQGPRFVFGGAGVSLSGLGADWDGCCVEWELGGCAHPDGYGADLVEAAIVAVPADLGGFGEAEQAVLENHGYLLAEAAAREHGPTGAGGIRAPEPRPPHLEWMDEEKVRAALVGGRRGALGRLRHRRAGH
jgi:hypothetical protein